MVLVRLIPGVNVERTPTLNQTGFPHRNWVRFQGRSCPEIRRLDAILSVRCGHGAARALHRVDFRSLRYRQSRDQRHHCVTGHYQRFEPDSYAATIGVGFSAGLHPTIGTPTVGITDPNITNVTTYDAIYFNTPVSVGGLILSGFYKIVLITGAPSTITATKMPPVRSQWRVCSAIHDH